ncbi:MAG: hypothetical protein J2P54_27500 [Bradyrhizobiaceae bacterium]|nr:hypothetical protein [Bradyrhizobiaceae bacterium]
MPNLTIYLFDEVGSLRRQRESQGIEDHLTARVDSAVHLYLRAAIACHSHFADAQINDADRDLLVL